MSPASRLSARWQQSTSPMIRRSDSNYAENAHQRKQRMFRLAMKDQADRR